MSRKPLLRIVADPVADWSPQGKRVIARVSFNLRRVRSIRALTQSQLALKAGTTRRYVSRLENGKENPTIDLLARLAAALNVDIIRLLRPRR
jgi:DNA-binding XRE family transcriptional regulator